MALNREQVVQTAEKYVSRGKIEQAIREYKKVLAENPGDANTLNRVGDLYARIQRIDEAVDFFTQIAEKYTEEGFFVKAIAIYKKIIKLDPTRLSVYEQLAELYHKQGLVNEARTQYQVLADYYQKHENPTSAIAIYQKMTELEPENPTYHVKLAELYGQQRLTEKALSEHRIIAELMLGHGHAQEAVQVYERGLDIDPDNAPFLTDAVLKLRESGHGAEAARLLAAATERNPDIGERLGRLVGMEEPSAAGPAAAATAFVSSASAEAWEVATEPGVDELGFAAGPAEEEVPLEAGGPGLPAAAREELLMALEEVEAATASAAAPPAARAAAPPPEAAPAVEEFDLDLDDVFVLDIEEEEEPASLVKPPPDMLDEAPRRPAWAQQAIPLPGPAAPPAPAPAAPSEEEAWDEIALELPADLDEVQVPGPAAGSPSAASGAGMDLAAGTAAEADAPFSELLEEPEVSGAAASAGPAEELDLELEPFDVDGAFELDLTGPGLEAGLAEAPGAAAADAAPDAFGFEPGAEPVPDLEPPAVPAPAEASIDPDLLERTAAELHPAQPIHREEDLVTEAEMLAKYGLEEKALERVREALRLNPRHLDAYALMVHLHLEKGRHARVVAVANQMSQAAARVSNREPWLKLKKRLAAAGYRLDGDLVVAPPQARPEDDGVGALLRGLLGGPAGRTGTGRPAAPPPDLPEPAPAVPPSPASREPAAAAPPVAPVPPPSPARPLAVPPEPPAPVRFNPLEIGALVDGEDLEAAAPDLAAPAGLPPVPPPGVSPAPPPAASAPAGAAGRPSLDDTGMRWLEEAEAGRARQAGGGLFSEEDDFFDLAAELEQELSREDGGGAADLLVQPAEQSLEQIVEGFKKGVAENLSPTDYDTHFNLGIAYREMGLLDEAIGEFQLASKDPRLLVECCSMLGLCFLDKGLPELAIKWYRRGLESPRVSEEDSLGLLYDMGNVYESMGDAESAYKTFVELYGINTNYRDVVARIEELGRAR